MENGRLGIRATYCIYEKEPAARWVAIALLRTMGSSSHSDTGGAGVQYVYEFRGLFFATSDADVYGPYDKFTEAADSIGVLNVNATTSVWVSPEYRSKGKKPK